MAAAAAGAPLSAARLKNCRAETTSPAASSSLPRARSNAVDAPSTSPTSGGLAGFAAAAIGAFSGLLGGRLSTGVGIDAGVGRDATMGGFAAGNGGIDTTATLEDRAGGRSDGSVGAGAGSAATAAACGTPVERSLPEPCVMVGAPADATALAACGPASLSRPGKVQPVAS